MNMKKIIASAVAAVMTVGTMAVAASADALLSKTGNSSSAEKYVISFEGLTEDQVKSIVKIEASINVTSDYANGSVGYNDAEAGWKGDQSEASASGASTWTAEFAEGALCATDDDGNLAPYSEVQFWWVNDNADGTEGTISLESVKLLDASGNEVTAGAAAPAAENAAEAPAATEAPAAENAAAANTAPADKGNADTGVEGVAVVAALAVLAGGAVVVAKKRK
ncbi:MAG: NPXTG-anchored protein [[Eubacterium] siraeum]|nr:NPXTG-anchored protein [[Eubacterium] siraeum]